MLKSFQDLEKDWESFEQNDLREGTFPEGSVWRPVGKVVMVMMMVFISDIDDDDDDGGADDDDDDDDGAVGAMPIPFVLSQTFEIILTLEGITPETGNTIQVNLKRFNFPNFL